MPVIAPLYSTVNPHFAEPDILMTYSQVSGAFELLPKGQPRVKLSANDKAVYVNRLDLRTKMATSQASYNSLPNVELVFSYVSTPTYLARCRSQWDHHDIAAAGEYRVGLQQAYRLGMRQAHFQFMRTALLYGVNPGLGEGITNAAGATSTTLPADPTGNTTVVTYDNGAMGQYLLQLIGALKTRTNNLGIGREITILAPQRVLQQWEYSVVQLVQFQRAGAGTESTAGMTKLVAEMNEDTIKWVADDTLIGKGTGGGQNDLIVFVMPEVSIPDALNEIDTAEFSRLTPGFRDCTAMYCDRAAPTEITTPIAGGAVDVVSENRFTSGWLLRPEACTLLSA